jgi:hypothetical protein
MAGYTDGSFGVSHLMKPSAAASAARLKSSQATAIRDRQRGNLRNSAHQESGSGLEPKNWLDVGFLGKTGND